MTDISWRGAVTDTEINLLHADAFGHRVHSDEERPWVENLSKVSLGWVTARSGTALVGFLNVPWDGDSHAWLQDVIVAETHRHRGIATQMVETARAASTDAGCEWLHVDFDDDLKPFYFEALGFTPTNAGLIYLPGKN